LFRSVPYRYLFQILLLKQPCHLFFPNSSSRFFFNFCISREDDFLGGVSSTFSFAAKSITSADSLTLSGDKSNFSDSRFNCFSTRSEEHTSELQSRFDLVCRLLLEKKNK